MSTAVPVGTAAGTVVPSHVPWTVARSYVTSRPLSVHARTLVPLIARARAWSGVVVSASVALQVDALLVVSMPWNVPVPVTSSAEGVPATPLDTKVAVFGFGSSSVSSTSASAGPSSTTVRPSVDGITSATLSVSGSETSAGASGIELIVYSLFRSTAADPSLVLPLVS